MKLTNVLALSTLRRLLLRFRIVIGACPIVLFIVIGVIPQARVGSAELLEPVRRKRENISEVTVPCRIEAAGGFRGSVMTREELKKHWVPTEGAFQALLVWLDEGVDSGGTRYLEIRRRLVSYFDRRDCPHPDDNADETLNRVARRLEEQGRIVDTSPAHFCYLTAKFVLLESIRGADYRQRSLDEVPGGELRSLTSAPDLDPLSEDREKHLSCLEGCIEKLTAADRELILDYYQGERSEKIETRKRLAARLRITPNAVAIRAARIRNRLERCVAGCVEDDRKLPDSSHQIE